MDSSVPSKQIKSNISCVLKVCYLEIRAYVRPNY